MKMKQADYDVIKNAIASKDKQGIQAFKRDLKENGKYKDFDKRFRWDLFWLCNLSSWASDTLYKEQGLHDIHIDTALKAIVKELNL